MDFITGLLLSEGNTYMMIVMDRLGKGCKVIPISDLIVEIVVRKFIWHVVDTYWLLDVIVSDCGG
jgi:hypothetical protein